MWVGYPRIAPVDWGHYLFSPVFCRGCKCLCTLHRRPCRWYREMWKKVMVCPWIKVPPEITKNCMFEKDPLHSCAVHHCETPILMEKGQLQATSSSNTIRNTRLSQSFLVTVTGLLLNDSHGSPSCHVRGSAGSLSCGDAFNVPVNDSYRFWQRACSRLLFLADGSH